jgi:hypothetical protein
MRDRICSHKELDREIVDTLKMLEVPVEIPISFCDLNFGTVKINFEYKKEKISCEKRTRKAVRQ